MKGVKPEIKSRKLHREGCPQKAAAKRQGYAGTPIHVRIAEHNDILINLLVNRRKEPWRAALMLSSVLTNEEIARHGYITMTSYCKQVCEN